MPEELVVQAIGEYLHIFRDTVSAIFGTVKSNTMETGVQAV